VTVVAFGYAEESGLAQANVTPAAEEQTAVVDSLEKSENVTLDFKEADIRNVLKIISYKAGVNIVTTPEVMGNVSIRLVDVPWEKALQAILKTYGFGYERQGNIITVAPIDKLTAMKKQEVELAQVQPTVTEVFNLKYIDAADVKKAIESQISARGKITILEMTGQAGWEFGAGDLGKRKRITEGRISRSKVLIVSDIPPALEKIKSVIEKIDVSPQQIIIEAKLVEVNHDKLKDIGFTWGTGIEGPTSLTTYRNLVDTYVTTTNATTNETTQKTFKDIVMLPELLLNTKAANIMGAQFLPAVQIGELLFQRLAGTQFEFILKALETNGDANILSAPHLVTLNNQEASILIGQKYPLLKSTISTQTGTITGQSLDRYQDIGIQLNVVPQISGNEYINLIVHPAVSSFTQTVDALSSTGQKMASYPIILTREVDTQILIKDGETVAIGGLMKDVKSTSITGLPILKDIPLLGLVFQRKADTIQKIDLIIFLTARIAKDVDFSPEQIIKLKARLGRNAEDSIIPETKKKKKKK
jgi:type IV pilus assembly protein PilQ